MYLLKKISQQLNSFFLSFYSFKTKCGASSSCDWIPLSSTILSLIILACCEFHRRQPYNYIALIYFTASAGVFLMVVTTKIEEMIFYTIIIFAASILGLTLFSCQTKFKYTIYTGLGTILICDIIAFIVLYASNNGAEKWDTYLYSEILATVFLLVIHFSYNFLI